MINFRKELGRDKVVWSILHCVAQSRDNSVMSREKQLEFKVTVERVKWYRQSMWRLL